MNRSHPTKLTALATAAMVTLGMVLPALVSADPAKPRFVIAEKTNQAGVFDPANGKYNSAWFSLSVANDGTSTYTQMHLVVSPNDPTVVARAALDAAKQVPTASPLCTLSGNTFDCVWPTNLGGGGTTSPITFVFGAPNDPLSGAPPPSYDVNAVFTSKDHTTTSGGGSGQDRDISAAQTITINTSPRIDQQTPYLLPTTTSVTVSTWKKNGVAALTLPASTTGYMVDLSESELGGDVEACTLNADNAFAWAQYARADVNRGATITPYLAWTTSSIWDNRDGSLGPAPVPPAVVVHCVQNADGTYTTHVLTLAANNCSGGLGAYGCVVKIDTKVQGNKGSIYVITTFSVTFRTPTNGYTKPH